MQSVIAAHGGLERWRKITSIDVTWNFSGFLLALKGFPRHYQPTCTIDVKNTKTVIQGLGEGDRDDRWIYTPHRVWIERRDGRLLKSRDKPRESFKGQKREDKWDDLQLLYFIGYAMHNYLTCPFKFVELGFVTREVEPHVEKNGDEEQTWRVLEVTFPIEEYPSHNRTQMFYFDEAFMLRRVDYAPDVLFGNAAHYVFDAKDFDGIKVPTYRRVVMRVPGQPSTREAPVLRGLAKLSGPSGFRLDYCDVTFRED